MTSVARAEWDGAASGGFDFAFQPELEGFGWILFDAVGRDVAGDGDLHIYYNTDTLEIGLERLSLGTKKVEFSIAARGEVIFAGLLHAYYKQGVRINPLGFNAGYVQLIPKLQYHFANFQTLEVLLTVRRWFFADRSNTDPTLVLPAEAWVFEPRLGYIFWKVRSGSDEWQAHRVFPRIVGTAFSVTGALDVRSKARPWGIPDGRNDPEELIWAIQEQLRAGWQVSTPVRIQLEQWGSWGWNQDDLTRYRIGGMNPYVVPVPGLPWAALLSERLFMAQLGAHFRPKAEAPHELGLYVAGGTLNDVRREGDLDRFGGTGGLSMFGDMRFGRVQVHARFGWAFPVSWLIGSPYLSALATVGVELF